MKLFSKFTLSLMVQCILITLAMGLLDGGRTAIALALLCTAWNLVLILDWALCKTGLFRRDAMMLALPTGIHLLLPVIFFGVALEVRW